MLLASLTLMSMFATPADAPMSVWTPEDFCPEDVVETASTSTPTPLDWCTERDGVSDPRCSSSMPFGAPSSDSSPSRRTVDLLAAVFDSPSSFRTVASSPNGDGVGARSGVTDRIDRPPIS